MERVKIKMVQVGGGERVSDFVVMATDSAGRQYYFEPLPYRKAVILAERVEQRGSINPELWDRHIPYGTVAWLIDGMEQRQIEDERFGY